MEKIQVQSEHPSFETVWASLQETDRMVKELRESQKETDRLIRETGQQMKETDRRLDKQLGKLGNRFGEMVEYMVKPCLVEKFGELGLEFTEAAQEVIIKDKKNNILTEVDFTLKNDEMVILIEVKTKPTTGDVTDHIERMEKVRTHARLHNDNRKYLGAIGGMVINENEKTFALKNGFYVVEPSGDTFAITVPEGIYSPREW